MKHVEDGLMCDWRELQREYLEQIMELKEEQDAAKVRARFEPIYREIDNSPIKVPLDYLLFEGPVLIDNLVHTLRLTQLSLREGVFNPATAAEFIQGILDKLFKQPGDALEIPY